VPQRERDPDRLRRLGHDRFVKDVVEPAPRDAGGGLGQVFTVEHQTNGPDLEPGLTLRQLLETIESDLIGMNRLMGTYERA